MEDLSPENKSLGSSSISLLPDYADWPAAEGEGKEKQKAAQTTHHAKWEIKGLIEGVKSTSDGAQSILWIVAATSGTGKTAVCTTASPKCLMIDIDHGNAAYEIEGFYAYCTRVHELESDSHAYLRYNEPTFFAALYERYLHYVADSVVKKKRKHAILLTWSHQIICSDQCGVITLRKDGLRGSTIRYDRYAVCKPSAEPATILVMVGYFSASIDEARRICDAKCRTGVRPSCKSALFTVPQTTCAKSLSQEHNPKGRRVGCQGFQEIITLLLDSLE